MYKHVTFHVSGRYRFFNVLKTSQASNRFYARPWTPCTGKQMQKRVLLVFLTFRQRLKKVYFERSKNTLNLPQIHMQNFQVTNFKPV